MRLCFLVIWAFASSVIAWSANIPTVRVMPLGDSITEGCCQPVGGAYRTQLYALLNSAGYNVDFIGTLQDDIPPASLPDIDHEGHDGFRIDEIDAGIEGWLSVLDDPDVILLHIGTNDAAQNFNFATAPNRLENLIAHLAAQRPFAKIIVASLIVAADPTIESRVVAFNSAIPGIVTHQVSLGNQVFFVDMHSCCGTSDLSDPVGGLHPNATGYAKMANTWFPALTSVISPSGTADPPAILAISGQMDLRHVIVTYSKPVDDASATTLGNYSLSGGVSVSQASLDSSKREVTLTTSVQATSTTYTLTISNVKDRTAQQNRIPNGTTASFLSGAVAEAANYSLVYSLNLPNQAEYNSTGVPYEIDNHTSLGSFNRVAYYMALQPSGGGPLQWVWVSMDAFTSDPSKIGVPTIQSGGFFQQTVSHMNVRSSVAGLTTGDSLSGGNIEFFWGSYNPANAANVPGASSTRFDFGDSASPSAPSGYGSMQVHNWAAGQTVFAFNAWGVGSSRLADLGIGKAPTGEPDWTFAENATNFITKKLQVYAQPGSISTFLNSSIFYNHSSWDGNNPGADANDDNAIATDKVALRGGGVASFANYTSFSLGINGIMIDVSTLPGAPAASDFVFKVGNDSSPSGWSPAPNPSSITVRHGAGTSGSDRITLIWPDNAIQKQWLQVMVLPTPNTGLASSVTFYYGNAIADSGNSATDAHVDVIDENAARIHPRTFLSPALINDHYDYNRDQRVDIFDENLARINGTTFLNALKLIDLSGLSP